ncbi:MAG: C-GCAxxG-C-C family protein [Deltaproteobacteria bacterium]|jgi:hypothetical protein|nr:C-GCAxxG-C-C family protein [Deltaproteobacteria bacterium]
MLDETGMEVMALAGSGYSCAQIVLVLGLRVMGRENPDLVRAMAPMAMGASFGSVCGALTGGLCLLGLHLGKGLDFETPALGGKIPPAALVKWFLEDPMQGRIPPTCAAVFESTGTRLDVATSAPAPACADLVARTYSKAMALLVEHGVDPSEGRDLA